MVEPSFSTRFAAPSFEVVLKVAPHHVVVLLVLLVDVLKNDFVFTSDPISNGVS